MGDMADFTNETSWGNDWYVYTGPKTCRHCGNGDMEWTSTGRGWRLFDMKKREIHTCVQYKPRK